MSILDIAKTLAHDPNAPSDSAASPDIPPQPNSQILLQFDFSSETQNSRVLAFPKMFYGMLVPMIKATLADQGFQATQEYSWDAEAVETLRQTLTENDLDKCLPSNLHLDDKYHVFFIRSNITDSDYSRLLVHVLSQPTDPNIIEQVRIIEQTVPNDNIVKTC